MELLPPSPLVCLRFNVKTPDILVGGCVGGWGGRSGGTGVATAQGTTTLHQSAAPACSCYNGLVGVFDTKKPRGIALTTSSIDRSHHDPVYDVFWVQSKTNNQFVSVSTGEGRGERER